MKIPLRNIPLLAALFCSQTYAEEVQTPPANTIAAIPLSPEPAPSEAAPAQEKPDFEIESTQIKLIEVVEAPPMSGLPPVEGTMKLTINTVADPGIADPASAIVQLQNQEPENEIPITSDSSIDSHLLLVSAMVYDHSRTLLTFNQEGGVVSVWSNIDFNHFSGVGNFEAKGSDGKVRSYNLIMSIGNETAASLEESDAPAIPVIPNGAPAFVIQSGQQPNAATLTLIEDLHALYRTEGLQMAEAAAARQKAEDEMREYLMANPPKPKDVTVNFWKRDIESQPAEGGQP